MTPLLADGSIAVKVGEKVENFGIEVKGSLEGEAITVDVSGTTIVHVCVCGFLCVYVYLHMCYT